MRRWLVILWFVSMLGGWAETRSPAFVISFKGEVFKRDRGPDRDGTVLRMLERLPENTVLRVKGGGTVTLAFAKGGKKVTIKAPGDYTVKATEVTPGGPGVVVETPQRGGLGYKVQAVDLSRFGATPARSVGLATIHQRQNPVRIDIFSLPRNVTFSTPGNAIIYWRASGASEWTEATARIEHDGSGETFLVPQVDFQPSTAYQICVLRKSDQPDFWVYLYGGDQLADLNKSLALAKGGDLDEELLAIDELCQLHLYDEALDRCRKLQGPQARDLEQKITADRNVSWWGTESKPALVP